MVTFEQLKAVNESIKTVDVKGKKYAQVNERVKAFRQICPMGQINTEIIALDNGVVTMKATITDEEGHILGTGFAQEKESSSYINKTSYIENCETSAVGRALGFAGIGVDGSMASAEEVANAILNQGTKVEHITPKEAEILKNLCKDKGLNIKKTFPGGIDNLSPEQYVTAIKRVQGYNNEDNTQNK